MWISAWDALRHLCVLEGCGRTLLRPEGLLKAAAHSEPEVEVKAEPESEAESKAENKEPRLSQSQLASECVNE